jgi:hypothetical protein
MPVRLFFFLCCCFLIGANCLQAQVKPPAIRQFLPEKGVYRFPAFNEGSVVFRNGIVSAARLNFNISLDEMHFISERGDTLSVADPATISFVNLNGSRFYYDKGFLQTIDTAAANGILLAYRQVLSAQQQRDIGAYGITRPQEGIRKYRFYNGNGQMYNIGGDDKITVTSRESYFFGDIYGHFSRADRQYILQHFSQQEAVLKDFIKAQHTNFNRLDDLLELMQFCRELK